MKTGVALPRLCDSISRIFLNARFCDKIKLCGECRILDWA